MDLQDLKARIERIENRARTFSTAASAHSDAWTVGIDAVDRCLPEPGIAPNALHDITPAGPVHAPSAGLFALALLARLPRQGPVVWCQTAHAAREHGRPYAPGLIGLAMEPERFVFVSVSPEREFAPVLEEVVRTRAVAAVVGEGPPIGFTASRRLILASEISGVPCLHVNTAGLSEASAAVTRWRIAAQPGPEVAADPKGPGYPAWRLGLVRARGGRPRLNDEEWHVYWDNETRSFHSFPPLRDGSIRDRRTAPATLRSGTARRLAG